MSGRPPLAAATGAASISEEIHANTVPNLPIPGHVGPKSGNCACRLMRSGEWQFRLEGALISHVVGMTEPRGDETYKYLSWSWNWVLHVCTQLVILLELVFSLLAFETRVQISTGDETHIY
jgi:hypothetical protein